MINKTALLKKAFERETKDFDSMLTILMERRNFKAKILDSELEKQILLYCIENNIYDEISALIIDNGIISKDTIVDALKLACKNVNTFIINLALTKFNVLEHVIACFTHEYSCDGYKSELLEFLRTINNKDVLKTFVNHIYLKDVQLYLSCFGRFKLLNFCEFLIQNNLSRISPISKYNLLMCIVDPNLNAAYRKEFIELSEKVINIVDLILMDEKLPISNKDNFMLWIFLKFEHKSKTLLKKWIEQIIKHKNFNLLNSEVLSSDEVSLRMRYRHAPDGWFYSEDIDNPYKNLINLMLYMQEEYFELILNIIPTSNLDAFARFLLMNVEGSNGNGGNPMNSVKALSNPEEGMSSNIFITGETERTKKSWLFLNYIFVKNQGNDFILPETLLLTFNHLLVCPKFSKTQENVFNFLLNSEKFNLYLKSKVLDEKKYINRLLKHFFSKKNECALKGLLSDKDLFFGNCIEILEEGIKLKNFEIVELILQNNHFNIKDCVGQRDKDLKVIPYQFFNEKYHTVFMFSETRKSNNPNVYHCVSVVDVPYKHKFLRTLFENYIPEKDYGLVLDQILGYHIKSRSNYSNYSNYYAKSSSKKYYDLSIIAWALGEAPNYVEMNEEKILNFLKYTKNMCSSLHYRLIMSMLFENKNNLNLELFSILDKMLPQNNGNNNMNIRFVDFVFKDLLMTKYKKSPLLLAKYIIERNILLFPNGEIHASLFGYFMEQIFKMKSASFSYLNKDNQECTITLKNLIEKIVGIHSTNMSTTLHYNISNNVMQDYLMELMCAYGGITNKNALLNMMAIPDSIELFKRISNKNNFELRDIIDYFTYYRSILLAERTTNNNVIFNNNFHFIQENNRFIDFINKCESMSHDDIVEEVKKFIEEKGFPLKYICKFVSNFYPYNKDEVLEKKLDKTTYRSRIKFIEALILMYNEEYGYASNGYLASTGSTSCSGGVPTGVLYSIVSFNMPLKQYYDHIHYYQHCKYRTNAKANANSNNLDGKETVEQYDTDNINISHDIFNGSRELKYKEK